MLLTSQVILIGIFTVVGFLTGGTYLFEGRFGGCSVRRSLSRQDFLREDLGRQWGK